MFKFFPRARTKEYIVPVAQDEWVTPEETLLDSSSGYSNIEKPISANVFRFATIAVMAVTLIILAASFKMTVIDHAYFAALAFKNKTVNFSIPPPRGLITDRNGRSLVSNIPSFDLLVVSRGLAPTAEKRKADLQAVAGILGKPAEEFETFIREDAKKHAVFFAASDMTKDQVLALKNLDIEGLSVITGTRRHYVDGPQFSGVIGYVGRIGKDDLVKDSYYLPSDMAGRIGIEASYETDLRGDHGTITYVKKGEEGISEEPRLGDTVQLHIDYEAQKKLYNILFEILTTAKLGEGAAIVQDPRTGAVIAMVSFPGFDNNIFNDEVSESEFKRLFQSRLKPLFNRVIAGRYNPGSTIKPFIGLAALQEKIVTPKDVIQDCINITILNPYGGAAYVFSNWRPIFGPVDMRRAIATSCNVYFWAVGGGFERITGMGAEKIASYLGKALANVKLGIDIPGEDGGFVPTPAWKKKTRGEPWYQGDTYNISVGQGDLLVTPLWLNAYISAIGNGGTMYQPQVADKILDDQKNLVRDIEPKAIAQLPFSSEHIEEMRLAMRETVLTGTASLLQGLPVKVAAKTGTAEVIKGRTINAVFTAFAPYDNPELSITVLAEGSATNQGYAIRAANEFMKWYFSRDKKPVPATP